MDAIRYWRRHPRFAAAAMLVLSLGIGSVAAAWTLLETAVLRPLPFAESSRLIDVTQLRAPDHVSGMGGATVPLAAFEQWRHATSSIDDLAAYANHDALLSGSGDAVRTTGSAVSSNFFNVLRTKPLLGGTLIAEDDVRGAPPRVVLSHSLWQSMFGGDSSIVGRGIGIDGTIATVVGVMPAGFEFPAGAKVWRSLGSSLRDPTLDRATLPIYSLVGRLTDGASLEQAERDLVAMAELRWTAAPELHGWLPVLRSLPETVIGDSRRPLAIVVTASVLLLLVACANVGNLLLARSLSREREFDVRRALGATSGSITRQIAAETAVIVVGGTIGGVLIALWSGRAVTSAGETLLGRSITVEPSFLTLAIVVSAISLIAFLTALAPLYVSRLASRPVQLRTGFNLTSTRRQRSTQGAVQVLQLSFTMFVLVAATLLSLSYARLRALDLGFDADRMLIVSTRPPSHEYPNAQSRALLASRLKDRLSTLGGVSAVAVASGTPFDWADVTSVTDTIAGDPELVWLTSISSQYFAAAGIPLLAGRDFREGEDSLSIILDRQAAEALFPSRSPIGRDIELYGTPRRVVGVVGNTYQESLRAGTRPHFFLPMGSRTRSTVHLIVGTTVEPEHLATRIRSVVREIAPGLPIDRLSTGSSVVNASIRTDHILTLLLGAASVAIVLITICGVYASTSQSVARNARSLAIRKALGQGSLSLFAGTVRNATGHAGVAALIGGVSALLAARILDSTLYATTASSWEAYVVAAVVLVIFVGVAAVPSASRAASSDPAHALKAE